MNASELEAALLWQIKVDKVPAPVTEHRFAPPRRWRFDLAWPDRMLAVEVEGGIWNGGRHVTAKGFEGDLEKMNAAVLHGWRVLRFTRSAIEDGSALDTIKQALQPEAVK